MTQAPSASEVKALRERTGAGVLDCRAALEEAGGDFDRAVEILRLRGQAEAAKRVGRAASEGVVESYIHAGATIGVLVEVDCETDFVARNEDFRRFAREVALQVAATAPRYVAEEDVPAEVRAGELRLYEEQAADKPEHVRSKVAEGRLRKWLEEVVLLHQVHVNSDRHAGKTIEELRAETADRYGENVVIRRFARFAVGEE